MAHKPPTSLDSLVIELVDSGRVPRSAPHDCPYLPDRKAVEEGFVVEAIKPETYHELMDRGFRRSGQVFYRPRCPGCDLCRQIRLPVADFHRSKSQRRTWNRNDDVTINVTPPNLTDEKMDVYKRYLKKQHPDSRQAEDPEGIEDFLYLTAVDTVEVTYHAGDDDKLIAVSIIDVSRESLSSVYHYFDPEESHRRMGVYSVLREVELAREWGVPYYYLGYWVEGAPTMDYKASYYPHELLIDGQWERREKS